MGEPSTNSDKINSTGSQISRSGTWGLSKFCQAFNPILTLILQFPIYIYLEPGVDRYLIYWQLGAWFQICRELEDQGYIPFRIDENPRSLQRNQSKLSGTGSYRYKRSDVADEGCEG